MQEAGEGGETGHLRQELNDCIPHVIVCLYCYTSVSIFCIYLYIHVHALGNFHLGLCDMVVRSKGVVVHCLYIILPVPPSMCQLIIQFFLQRARHT